MRRNGALALSPQYQFYFILFLQRQAVLEKADVEPVSYSTRGDNIEEEGKISLEPKGMGFRKGYIRVLRRQLWLTDRPNRVEPSLSSSI